MYDIFHAIIRFSFTLSSIIILRFRRSRFRGQRTISSPSTPSLPRARRKPASRDSRCLTTNLFLISLDHDLYLHRIYIAFHELGLPKTPRLHQLIFLPGNRNHYTHVTDTFYPMICSCNFVCFLFNNAFYCFLTQIKNFNNLIWQNLRPVESKCRWPLDRPCWCWSWRRRPQTFFFNLCKTLIWLILRCWVKLSLVEGRFSKWF